MASAMGGTERTSPALGVRSGVWPAAQGRALLPILSPWLTPEAASCRLSEPDDFVPCRWKTSNQLTLFR
jgi:hypothetical protein